MSRPRAEQVMSLARAEREFDDLLRTMQRVSHLRGFAKELKPLFLKEFARRNAELVRLGGRPRAVAP